MSRVSCMPRAIACRAVMHRLLIVATAVLSIVRARKPSTLLLPFILYHNCLILGHFGDRIGEVRGIAAGLSPSRRWRKSTNIYFKKTRKAEVPESKSLRKKRQPWTRNGRSITSNEQQQHTHKKMNLTVVAEWVALLLDTPENC